MLLGTSYLGMDEESEKKGIKTHSDFKLSYVVVSNIFYVYPYLGKWSNLTSVLQMGWNHQLLLMEEILHHLGCIRPCK